MAQPAAAQDYLPHPVAELFPLMSGRMFEALVKDIRERGQLHPIVLTDGLILDGRNRWLAAKANGLVPATVEWNRVGTPLAYVVSHNLRRRQLTMGQRCMIAGRLANMKSGARTDLVKVFTRSELSAQEAADLLDVSRPQVFHAKTVLDHGTPAEIELVDSGTKAVSTIATQIRRRLGPPQYTRKPTSGGGPMADIIEFPTTPERKQRRCHIPRLPDGMSPEDVARKALELRKTLSSVDAVAKRLGIERNRCRRMMDIVQIADRTDLAPREATIAATALRRMNENRHRLDQLHAPIKPIMQRIWGNRRGPSRDALEASRKDRFEHGLGFLIQACLNGTRMEIPHMTQDRADTVVAELREAISSVKVLISRIERIAA